MLFLDSIFLCLTKPIEEMAKVGHEQAWADIFPSIFCIDESDPDLKREPGLLKVRNIHFTIRFIFSFRTNSKQATGR